MNSTYDTLRASDCTSCRVAEDLSNYCERHHPLPVHTQLTMHSLGFPKLYFQDPKTNKFESVPNGGLLIYYLPRGDEDTLNGGPGLKAFPKDFRMISGSPQARSSKSVTSGSQEDLAQRAVQWACLRYGSGNSGYEGVGGFPTTTCEAGFQSRLHFPSCWDGVVSLLGLAIFYQTCF